MNYLTKINFDRAKAFLKRSPRQLEGSLFEFFFEHASAQSALEALRMHQDGHGGFFDLGEGDSLVATPIGTTIGFQFLTDLHASADCSLVKKGIQYFLETFNEECQGWPRGPEDRNPLQTEWGNPSAEIIGYLWKYKEIVPGDFLGKVTNLFLERFRSMQNPIPPFPAICYARAANFVPPAIQTEVLNKLKENVLSTLERDHSRWKNGFFVKPYWYAMNPQSLILPFPDLMEEIVKCLDFDIETQQEDGSFLLTFDVEGQGKIVWTNIWTLEILRVLSAFNRIEGTAYDKR